MKSPLAKLVLRQGSVFRMQHRDLTSALEHYCVVMNADPFHAETIVLTVATSKVKERKERVLARGMPPETLVEIQPSEYGPFTVPTLIDCNDVKPLDPDEFERMVLRKEAKSFPDMPPSVLARLIDGVRKSPVPSDRIKALLDA